MDQNKIIDKFHEIELHSYPFQHFVSKNFLSSDTVEKIQNELFELEKIENELLRAFSDNFFCPHRDEGLSPCEL